MSLRLESKPVERRWFQWHKSYSRLVAVGGITVDEVIPPFLAVVLERRGGRYPNLVHEMAVMLLRGGRKAFGSRLVFLIGAYRGIRIGGQASGRGGRGKVGALGRERRLVQADVAVLFEIGGSEGGRIEGSTILGRLLCIWNAGRCSLLFRRGQWRSRAVSGTLLARTLTGAGTLIGASALRDSIVLALV